jgi:thiol:disulfide interchange protein DsbD
VPYEVRALDQICYIGSVYPLTAVAALANVKPADQPFRLSVLLDETDRLELRWSVAPGYFLYRDKVSATLDGKPLKVSTARGEINDDPTLGPADIYHREARAYVDGGDLPESEEILVTYQGCRETAVCYSPITKSIDLATHSRMQAE